LYKDENGRWVFTDKPPKNAPSMQVEKKDTLFTERGAKAGLINRGTKQRPLFYAFNEMAGPVQIWAEFKQHTNVKFSAEPPYEWTLSASEERLVLQLEARDQRKGWSYEWEYHVLPGEPTDVNHLKSLKIGLPFTGGPFVVTQGFMGEASHSSSVDAYFAVDIAMPDGTPIIAVLNGVVMDVERNFSRSGWDREYMDEANFVRLLHEDGIMSLYAHLAPGSIEVAPGQKVRAGQILGLSGSTGFSTGPHLHFAIQANKGRELVSIPFRFVDHIKELSKGDLLQNQH
jgi:murein DD-endopeptidase MepM/ murein hydrolase activator NlpD